MAIPKWKLPSGTVFVCVILWLGCFRLSIFGIHLNCCVYEWSLEEIQLKASKQYLPVLVITKLYKVTVKFDELYFREVLYSAHNNPNVLVCGIPKV